MLGITNLSKVPLRLVTLSGFASSVLCIFVSIVYCLYKLLFWNNFSLGMAPLVIGVFFFASLQMIFMGIIGEYIGAIHTLVQKRPFVFEKRGSTSSTARLCQNRIHLPMPRQRAARKPQSPPRYA